MRRPEPVAGVVLTGIPEPDYTTHGVAAYAETSASNGCEVKLARTSDGAVLLEFEARALRFVGSTDRGGTFECDDVDGIRALAGALLGALAAAERAGIIAPAAMGGRAVG